MHPNASPWAARLAQRHCQFVWAGNSEELESLGLSAARDFADAALYAPHFFVDAFITVMPTALF